MAVNLMLLGTHSGVGKHTLCCGILRSLSRRGIDVSPFKALSVDEHSCRLPNGAIVAFAIALQSLAAGKTPTVDMNPYVASYRERFTLYELGRPLLPRPDMVKEHGHYLGVIRDAFARVAASAGHVVAEGAGSPVELGVEAIDLANLPVAELSRARLLLIGDMSQGGAYASLLGTLSLLPAAVRSRVAAIVLNKFEARKPIELASRGIELLEERAGLPVRTFPRLDDPLIPGDSAFREVDFAELGDYTDRFDALADLVDKHLGGELISATIPA
jgi:adenosylcobyric acid synthase